MNYFSDQQRGFSQTANAEPQPTTSAPATPEPDSYVYNDPNGRGPIYELKTASHPSEGELQLKRGRLDRGIHINFDAINYAVPANDGSPSGVYLMPEMHFYSTLDKAIEAWVSRLPLSDQDRLDTHEALWEELTDQPELAVTLRTLGLTHPRQDEIRTFREQQSYMLWKRQEQERLDRIAREEAELEEERQLCSARDADRQEQFINHARDAEERRKLRQEARVRQTETVLTHTQQAAKTQAEIIRERMAVVRSYRFHR